MRRERDGYETEAGRRGDKNVADVLAEDDRKLAEVNQFLAELDAALGPVKDGKRPAGPKAGRKAAGRASRPAGRGGERGPVAGRRRVRRFGDAARKAAQSEIADGRQARPRSLRATREAFPFSQAELADRTRLSRATIGALESGRRRAHPKTRRAIARVLGVLPPDIAWE
jgi:DNA-binding XRE family transcriptional regulator